MPWIAASPHVRIPRGYGTQVTYSLAPRSFAFDAYPVKPLQSKSFAIHRTLHRGTSAHEALAGAGIEPGRAPCTTPANAWCQVA